MINNQQVKENEGSAMDSLIETLKSQGFKVYELKKAPVSLPNAQGCLHESEVVQQTETGVGSTYKVCCKHCGKFLSYWVI